MIPLANSKSSPHEVQIATMRGVAAAMRGALKRPGMADALTRMKPDALLLMFAEELEAEANERAGL
jgi:hypothetical protein